MKKEVPEKLFIEIVERATSKIEKRLGPFATARLRDKADAGLTRQLDHDRFYTKYVEEGIVEMAGSSPALRIECPDLGCRAKPGAYCTKLSDFGGGRIQQTTAHKVRREAEKASR